MKVLIAVEFTWKIFTYYFYTEILVFKAHVPCAMTW